VVLLRRCSVDVVVALLLQLAALLLQRCNIAVVATLRCCSSRHGSILQHTSLQQRCFATSGATLFCSNGGRRRLNVCFFFFFLNSLVEGEFVHMKQKKRKKEKKKGALKPVKNVKNLNFVGWHNTSSFL
jgi:hypothetical protein